MLKIIALVNIFFMYNFLFINDEFVICLSLLTVFAFLLISLKKYVIHLFFYIFDNVYFYFYILLNTNKHIYEYLMSKYMYVYFLVSYNQIDLFLTFVNIVYINKIKDINAARYIKKIKIIYMYANVILFTLKYLNNIVLNNNLLKNYKIINNTYNFLITYNYKNRTKNFINFIC